MTDNQYGNNLPEYANNAFSTFAHKLIPLQDSMGPMLPSQMSEMEEFLRMSVTNALHLDYLHCVIGMSEEILEITEAYMDWRENSNQDNRTHIIEEIGDLLWYTSSLVKLTEEIEGSHITAEALQHEMVNNIESYFDRNDTNYSQILFRISIAIKTVLNLFKKYVYYSKPINFDISSEMYKNLAFILCGLKYFSEECCSMFIEDVMNKNILKLRARYPDKVFSAEAANNRNVENEYKAMGK